MSMHWVDADRAAMRAALTQANVAAEEEEIPVGAVVVLAGEVIACGHNRTVREHDPTGHAEIVALRAAGIELQNHRLVDATLYVTLEPCAMCVGAMIQARIRRLVFGAYDEKAGAAGSVLDLSSDRSFNHRFEVNGGLLQDECAALLKEFFRGKRA
jgi:tRNA(adenine34) deaminase